MDKIQILGARKVFQEATANPIIALESVDLSVGQNEFVAIVGPSGCGKSTLLYMLGGFLKPTGGRILIDGEPVQEPGPDRGVVFQHFALFPWKTVLGNVEYGLAEKGLPRAERRALARRYIEMVKLSGFEEVYPNRLSGGMQQRVALARTLACDPNILLMDEPFGSLDAQTRRILQEELLEIWSCQKKTVIFVTHDVREAVFLAERVAVMTARPGRVKAEIDTRLESGGRRGAVEEKAEQIWAILREEVEKTIIPLAGDGGG